MRRPVVTTAVSLSVTVLLLGLVVTPASAQEVRDAVRERGQDAGVSALRRAIPDPVPLLLPAVQEIRESAARPSASSALPDALPTRTGGVPLNRPVGGAIPDPAPVVPPVVQPVRNETARLPRRPPQEMLHLQQLMESKSELEAMVSNVMKAVGDAQSIIQSLKGS